MGMENITVGTILRNANADEIGFAEFYKVTALRPDYPGHVTAARWIKSRAAWSGQTCALSLEGFIIAPQKGN